MKPFDVLDKETLIPKHLFLEASAGTGKTFAIEHVLARLVLENVSLDDILIVTFTKAATRDLRARILQNLKTCIQLLKSGSPSSVSYLQETLEKQNSDEAIFLLEIALAKILDAHIYTIHGFCHYCLNRFAFEGNISFYAKNQTEETESQNYKYILDFIRYELSDKHLLPVQLSALLHAFSSDMHATIKSLCPILEEKKSYPNICPFEKSAASLRVVFKKYKHFKNLQRMIPWFLKPKSLNYSLEEQVQALEHFITDPDLDIECLQFFLPLSQSIFICFAEDKRKKRLSLSEKEHTLLEEFEVFRKEALPLLEGLFDKGVIQVQLGKHLKSYIEKRKQAEDCLDVDNLLPTMVKALSNPKFLNQIKAFFKAIIIDEFQDTDPMQWQIFDLIGKNLKELRLFCIVGDPKQSIYSFRGADLQTYFKAKESFSGSSHFVLNTNFRSHPKLIHALNHMFMQLPKWFQYVPVSPGKQDQSSEIAKVEFLVAKAKKKPQGKIWPSEGVEKEFLLPAIVNKILKHQSEGISFDEQVILVKDRYQAKNVEQFLNEQNIPTVSNARMNLCETPMYEFFILLMQAFNEPNNLSFIKQVISTGYIAVPLSLLAEDMSSIFIREVVGVFCLHSKLLEEKGLAKALESFFEYKFFDGKCFWDNILSQNNLSDYSDCMQIIDLLVKLKSHKHLNAKQIYQYLYELIKQDPNQDKRIVRVPLKDKSAVMIMTTFMSKGLEYEVVYALGLCSRQKNNKTLLRGADDTLIFNRDSHKDYYNRLWQVDEEKLRQLYVGFTRAKMFLYIPFAIDRSNQASPLAEKAPLELYLSLSKDDPQDIAYIYQKDFTVMEKHLLQLGSCSDITITYLEEENANKYDAYEEQPINIKRPLELQVPHTIEKYLSFSSIAKPSTHYVDIPEHLTIPAGAETGVIFHRLFELIVENGLNKAKHKSARQKMLFSQLHGGYLGQQSEEVVNLIEQTLSIKLPGEDFALCDVDPSKMLQELEFLYPVSKDSYMKGFADLIFSHEGKYYLVDWKTNALTSYDQKVLEESMRAHDYFKQASIYSIALQRYVNLIEDADFETLFGGVFYVFVRGLSIYHLKPSRNVCLS